MKPTGLTEETVILVDGEDRPIGEREKLLAHLEGVLHRAFSVFVVDEAGRWLIQRRHPDKYHSGGLWSNTCCGHPRPGESTPEAAARRLVEEMGLHCPLSFMFSFRYTARLNDGLSENEFDHVLCGMSSGDPIPNPDEVDGWRWVAPQDLVAELERTPDQFTAWFRLICERVLHQMPAPQDLK